MRPARRRASGQIRQEGKGIRIAACLGFAAIFIAGCGSRSGPTDLPKPDETKPPEEKLTGVRTGAAEATRRSLEGSRGRLWKVKWSSAILETSDEGRVFGEMEKVAGTIYRNDKEVSDFYGERAVSKRDSDVLALEGKVRVISRQPKATMYCDRLEWHGDRELVIAKGNVWVVSPLYDMEAGSEVWCAPDLSRVATPDLFKEKHGRTP
jgi:hypothetical protein